MPIDEPILSDILHNYRKPHAMVIQNPTAHDFHKRKKLKLLKVHKKLHSDLMGAGLNGLTSLCGTKHVKFRV